MPLLVAAQFHDEALARGARDAIREAGFEVDAEHLLPPGTTALMKAQRSHARTFDQKILAGSVGGSIVGGSALALLLWSSGLPPILVGTLGAMFGSVLGVIYGAITAPAPEQDGVRLLAGSTQGGWLLILEVDSDAAARSLEDVLRAWEGNIVEPSQSSFSSEGLQKG